MKRSLKPCGTTAAYGRHLYNGEIPCEACRSAVRLASRKFKKNSNRSNSKAARKNHLRDKYGLTSEDVERIFDRQGSCCACCKSTEPKGRHGWCVDHDHETNTIRGILCSPCNSGIGFLGDSLEAVEKAVEYLKRYRDLGGYNPTEPLPPKTKPQRQLQNLKHPRITPYQKFVKLEPHEPDQIRWLASLGYQQNKIAAFYSVSVSLVSMIVKNKVHAIRASGG